MLGLRGIARVCRLLRGALRLLGRLLLSSSDKIAPRLVVNCREVLVSRRAWGDGFEEFDGGLGVIVPACISSLEIDCFYLELALIMLCPVLTREVLVRRGVPYLCGGVGCRERYAGCARCNLDFEPRT